MRISGFEGTACTALNIIRNLIFDNCIALEKDKLLEILNKFNSIYVTDIEILKALVSKEFTNYEKGI